MRRTNEPGTCLWCGKKLRAFRWAYVWSNGERHSHRPWHGVTFKKEREPIALKDRGDFCTGACAQTFGRMAARNGYRFKPYKEDAA